MNVKKQQKFTEVKVVPSATILENCRTVVEKTDFVSTGVMSYAEGDMLEVEISNFDRFGLGENVKLTVYTPAGIYIIPSTIVGKDRGSLMIINPPQNQRKFHERRGTPRVEVSVKGIVASVPFSKASSERRPPIQPVSFQAKNISLSGIGFRMKHEPRLNIGDQAELVLDLGAIVPCLAEIIRSELDEEGVYYGAKFIQVAEDKLNSLRAFILREQISAHSTRKNTEDQKRM